MRRITSRLSRESSEKPAVVGRVDRIRLRTRPSLNHRSALWPSPTVVCNLDYPANRVSAVAEINQKVKKRRLIRPSTHSRTPAQLQCTYALTHLRTQPTTATIFIWSHCLQIIIALLQESGSTEIELVAHTKSGTPVDLLFSKSAKIFTLSNTNHFTTYNHHSTKLKFRKPARKNTKNTDTEPPSVITVLFTPGYHGMT